jgi:hypothetical protein
MRWTTPHFGVDLWRLEMENVVIGGELVDTGTNADRPS